MFGQVRGTVEEVKEAKVEVSKVSEEEQRLKKSKKE
jgi:hypothetical protein